MTHHKSWDINEETTGRFKNGKPIIAATFQNGLNDIEPDGSFVACDMRLNAVIDGVTTHQVKRGRYGQLRFSDTGSVNKHLCKIKDKNGKGISLKYLGGDSGLPDVAQGKPTFSSDNGVTIEHTPTYKGVKIELVISDPQTAPIEYPFSLKDYGQKYDYTIVDGAIIGTGEDGKIITLHAPYAVDANGEIGQVHYELTGVVNNLQTFKKVVDEAWLRSRVGEVRIDPSVTIEDGVDGGTLEDNLTYDVNPTFNYGALSFGAIRNQTTVKESELIKVLLTSLSGVTVTNAYFGFDVYDSIFFPVGNAHVILTTWGEGNKNNAAATTGESSYNHSAYPTLWNTPNCKGDGIDRVAAIDGTYSFLGVDSDTHFPVSNAAVQGMIDTPATNFGWVFETLDDNTGIVWRSSESTLGNKPYFYMEYTEGGVGRRRRMLIGGN